MSNRTRQHATISKRSPSPGWWLALSCLIGCVLLMIPQIHTIIVLQQQTVTQSTIVALTPCSIPDAPGTQQGVLLTLRFVDARSGQPDTVILPGCQQGVYHLGETFSVRYLSTDPTTIVQASPASDLPEGASLALIFLSLGLLLSSVIVAVGVHGFLEQRKYRQLFAELRRQNRPRKAP